MPTQSSGGLTKRDNDDISKLDIFEGEGAAITAYSATGFVVHEEYTEGAILAFPKKFWSWNAASVDDITIEKLAPIWLHNPAPRTLSFGSFSPCICLREANNLNVFRDPRHWHWPNSRQTISRTFEVSSS